MTYWVAAIRNEQIIMGADSRSSRFTKGEVTKDIFYSVTDVSEKLLGYNHLGQKIGIVTSGLACNRNNVLVSQVINRFFENIEHTYVSAAGCLEFFLQFLKNHYQDFYKEAQFCIGFFNNGKLSLAAYNGKYRVTDCDYIEADFTNPCRSSLSEEQFGALSIEAIPKTVIDIRKKQGFSSTVNGHVDTLLMSSTKYELNKGIKDNLANTPRGLLADASVSRTMLANKPDNRVVPLELLDTERSLQIGKRNSW